jgi:hypothetical protein
MGLQTLEGRKHRSIRYDLLAFLPRPFLRCYRRTAPKDDEETIPLIINPPLPSPPSPPLRKILTPNILTTLFAFALVPLHYSTFMNLYPLLLSTPHGKYLYGGLSLRPIRWFRPFHSRRPRNPVSTPRLPLAASAARAAPQLLTELLSFPDCVHAYPISFVPGTRDGLDVASRSGGHGAANCGENVCVTWKCDFVDEFCGRGGGARDRPWDRE